MIDGPLRDSKTLYQGINSSNKARLWEVPVATSEDLDDAVKAPQQSFRSWSKISWDSRRKVVAMGYQYHWDWKVG